MSILFFLPALLDRAGRDIAQHLYRLRPRPRAPSTLTGDIRFHRRFYSRILGNRRTILVYLPPGYDQATATRYPVLYLHDGQNVFDAATSFPGVEWQADETAQGLIEDGRIPPIIMVAIYHKDRMNEYAPVYDPMAEIGGKGEAYARFLVEELKPFIDHHYRTRPGPEDTAVAGSSMGGLISLYLAASRPEVFSMCGALSPSICWADRWINHYLCEHDGWAGRVRIWMDMGTEEGLDIRKFRRGTSDLQLLERVLRERGMQPGRDYQCRVIPGGRHHERDWAARFDRVLLFFFGR